MTCRSRAGSVVRRQKGGEGSDAESEGADGGCPECRGSAGVCCRTRLRWPAADSAKRNQREQGRDFWSVRTGGPGSTGIPMIGTGKGDACFSTAGEPGMSRVRHCAVVVEGIFFKGKARPPVPRMGRSVGRTGFHGVLRVRTAPDERRRVCLQLQEESAVCMVRLSRTERRHRFPAQSED